jgi:hypothetical protein
MVSFEHIREQPMAEIQGQPNLQIDPALDASDADGLRALDQIIREDPHSAKAVLSLYAEDSAAGDKWAKVLSTEATARHYPFRLTASLGASASREAVRHAEFDDTTEAAIRKDERIKTAISNATNKNLSLEAREKATKRVGMLRLAFYAGVLAAESQSDSPNDEAEDSEAATA